MTKDTYCSFCGARFEGVTGYPRTCASCHTTIWSNPIPVSVVLLPVRRGAREGLLVIRRGIEPGKGRLALPGGFLEDHETWPVGGVRELREETGLTLAAEALQPFWFTSTAPRPNRVLLFGASSVTLEGLPDFRPTDETAERGVIFGPDGLGPLFAFDLHLEAARRWFAARGNTGPHEYEPA
jgi:ADP-ribose pyrophosphatase YjhB (NUDIX family)